MANVRPTFIVCSMEVSPSPRAGRLPLPDWWKSVDLSGTLRTEWLLIHGVAAVFFAKVLSDETLASLIYRPRSKNRSIARRMTTNSLWPQPWNRSMLQTEMLQNLWHIIWFCMHCLAGCFMLLHVPTIVTVPVLGDDSILSMFIWLD